VSGTAGLTGSADTILVLKRNPGEAFGLLYVRGRDVIEAEIGLQFDDKTGKWLHVGGADDHRKSEQRRAILRVLGDNVDPMYPAEIAAALDKRQSTIRQALLRMHRAGEVSRLPNGKYYAAKT
jgi:DNA-binding transcriptional ArsR family regulator